MKIIVGLGNPDAEYKNTYHNLGFMAADAAAEKLGAEFCVKKCRALLAETRVGGEKVIVAKPQTYMNLSGESVRELINYFKVSTNNLLVIYDDYDLKAGVLRIRQNGSAGTHNGMRNIVKELGTENFARIRIGFRPMSETMVPLIEFVLSGIKKEDKPLFERAVTLAGKAAAEFAGGKSVLELMGQYNGSAVHD